MTQTYTQDSLGYYKILNLNIKATDEEIKINYRKMAKKWHPDYNKAPDAMEVFQKLSVAHDILSDAKKRLTYDLACIAYSRENFPDIFALKVYPNQKGEEDISVRSLVQQQITGRLINYKIEDKALICNNKEAVKAALKISLHNWVLGWWSLKSFFKVPGILRRNYKDVNENQYDSLAVLIHNALAYEQEHKYAQAYGCAAQAWEFASPEQKELLEKFMKSLPGGKETGVLPRPAWNYVKIQKIQLVAPAFLGLCLIFYVLAGLSRYSGWLSKDETWHYYQEVRHWRGGSSVDDMVVAKIMDIRVDLNTLNMLYHVRKGRNIAVMYGPSDKFDRLATLPEGKTVRVTGISPDKIWMRVMLDNGDMGFVHSETLEEGIGLPIPPDSKIYTGQR